MSIKPNIKKKKLINDALNQINMSYEECILERSLDKNIDMIKALFEDVEVVKLKYIQNIHNKSLKFCIVFGSDLVNASIINDNIIRPLMNSQIPSSSSNLIDILENQVLLINETEKTDQLSIIIDAISGGDTVLFVDGASYVLILNTKQYQTRQIEEPENEKNTSGPKEGFNESLMTNISLLRRKLKTPDLKMKFYTIGQRTRTKACICYIKGLADKNVLKELYKRLDAIDIDAVLDSNYVTELIQDKPFSFFRSTGQSARPDSVAAKLLEGRIALLLDGTPDVLTIPYLFIENFQSNEDYYINFYFSSFARLIRILAYVLTISVPALYVAIVSFHYEMLPTQFIISISTERQNAPLPASLEAFVLLIVFNILREAGIRIPSNIGQALSIVGALVIGQAAVEAELIAAPMIVIIGLTAITSLIVPILNTSSVFLRLILLVLASVFGLFGFIIGLSGILINILNQRSFGVCQVSPSFTFKKQNIKDIYIRAPIPAMKQRPNFSTDKFRIESENEHDN